MSGPKKALYIMITFIPIAAFLFGQGVAQDTTETDRNREFKKAANDSPRLINNHVDPGSIQVVMRADDFGFSNAANSACIKGYREGIITSVEVLVPGPWFLAAAELLKENPKLDVGVHLTLTCEWDNYKWAPLTKASSLLAADGFLPVTNSDFENLNYSLKEVERELRAQIELALKCIPQVSHLSTHMAAPTLTEKLRRIITKLSLEYKLPLEPVGVNQYNGMWAESVEQKENFLANCLNDCQPGLMVFVCHLALDNQETRAIKGSGQDAMVHMALHRQAETDAVTSERVKQIIKNRHIKLIGYADTYSSCR